ncbi:uncharacterized protein LOC124320450 [Daphnia pulicaria]|uniref:uncharacterized protein LOC124320450 n=1 Tax=Daphnia pulicaria TaxID=35523 RepID=UPI001EEB92B5|nr:uncharacterized protein LOC124320450 [Daphnia pulicaria]
MRSLIALILCLFLVFNADTSPIHEYFERPSVEPADRSLHIFRQFEKNLLGHKRFLAAPNDVITEDNVIEYEEINKAAIAQISSVLCEAGKTSGWLQCNDSTGETDRSEAEKICQAHGQTLWTYAPRASYQSYGFWICAKNRTRVGRKPY